MNAVAHEAGIFSPVDDADMEIRWLLLAIETIAEDFDSFTAEQAVDLRLVRDAANAMLLRVEQ